MLLRFLRNTAGQDLVEIRLNRGSRRAGPDRLRCVSQFSKSIVRLYTSISGTITGVEWEQTAEGM
jgi:hypothetical protein